MKDKNKLYQDSRQRQIKAWFAARDKRILAEEMKRNPNPDGFIFGHPVTLPKNCKGETIKTVGNLYGRK